MRWNAAAFGPGYRAVDQNVAAFVRRRGRAGYFFGAIATGVANARHVMRKPFSILRNGLHCVVRGQ
jgi:hypothetical protein